MSIDYKEALDLLKTEKPVYYDGVLKRKVTAVFWRRDVGALVPSLEVLDAETHSISYVGLDKVSLADDVVVRSPDGEKILRSIYRLEDILEQIRRSISFERGEGAAEGYVGLIREAIKLDEAICDYAIKESDRKVLETIRASKDISAEEIERESKILDEARETIDEESL